MFVVEYRTVSTTSGRSYPSQFANIGPRRAQTCADAERHLLATTPNVEVLHVTYVGAL